MLNDEEQPSALVAEVPATEQYRLTGMQAEPEASYWARCPVLCTVSREAIFDRLNPGGSSQVQPYPTRSSTEAQAELQELKDRYINRYTPLDQSSLSRFLKEAIYFASPPHGAVLSRRTDGSPKIINGAELASLFEDETPGLWHRHVLNVWLSSRINPLIRTSKRWRQVLSPPRQALIWHALETAISSALMAVWHYKWFAHGLHRVAFRERPWEADKTLPVVYDRLVTYSTTGPTTGDIRRDTLRPDASATNSPGTPRHPAYGSGHSTYSAAASHVLACLLPEEYRPDFDLLATNIGEARIWGGVHWRSDHEFGQQIGKVVGALVIEQLNQTHIAPSPSFQSTPPPAWTLIRNQALAFSNKCAEKGNGNFCKDYAPPS